MGYRENEFVRLMRREEGFEEVNEIHRWSYLGGKGDKEKELMRLMI